MPEPRKPMVLASASTRALVRAVARLPLERSPARLAAIDAELYRRAAEDRRKRRWAA